MIHLLGALVWVGGMFFAYVVLRPASAILEPPQRLTLWAGVLERFFRWVWPALLALLASGYWMMFMVFGGFATSGLHIHLMHGLGLLMLLLFLYVYFLPLRGLRQAVAAADWAVAGARLGRIRQVVAINLTLGLVVVAIGSGGRYL